MNKQEQIEEMANIPHKCIKSSCEDCIKNDRKCTDYKQAEALYDAGYRKVADGAVILTPEERDEEMKEIARLNRVEIELQELNIKYYNEAKDLRRKVAELKAENERLKEVIADQNELCWNCKKSVKEFAEKLRKKVISLNMWEFGEIDIIDVTDIDELLKEYEE